MTAAWIAFGAIYVMVGFGFAAGVRWRGTSDQALALLVVCIPFWPVFVGVVLGALAMREVEREP